MHRYQHLGRIGDLPETVSGHLEDRQLGSRAEPVLDAPEDTVGASVVPFELKHDIDDVLQDFRSGDVAFLGDVAYEDDRDAGLLRKTQKDGGHLADLRHGAWSRLGSLGEHRLDRIHNHQVRHHLPRLDNHILDEGFTEYVAVRAVSPKPVGPHLHLAGALLSGHVQRLQGRTAQRDLEREGGFSDTGFSSDEHQGTFHDASPEDPVDFSIAEGDPGIRGRIYLGKPAGTLPFPRHRVPADLMTAAGDRLVLGQGVPFPTGRALAHPLGKLIAAIGTVPDGLLLD